MTRRYEKVKNCPKELNTQIVLANLLPLNTQMPDILSYVRANNEFIKEQIEKRRNELKEDFGDTLPNIVMLTLFYDICIESARPDTLVTLRKVLIKLLKKFSNDFNLTLMQIAGFSDLKLKDLKIAPYTDIHKIILAYDYVRETRKALIEFVFRLQSERIGLDRTGGYFPFTIPATIEREEDGSFSLTGLAKLIGSFDPSRLKLCPICKYIYWAKRSDSKTCGEPVCINAFQNRKKKELRVNSVIKERQATNYKS